MRWGAKSQTNFIQNELSKLLPPAPKEPVPLRPVMLLPRGPVQKILDDGYSDKALKARFAKAIGRAAEKNSFVDVEIDEDIWVRVCAESTVQGAMETKQSILNNHISSRIIFEPAAEKIQGSDEKTQQYKRDLLSYYSQKVVVLVKMLPEIVESGNESYIMSWIGEMSRTLEKKLEDVDVKKEGEKFVSLQKLAIDSNAIIPPLEKAAEIKDLNFYSYKIIDLVIYRVKAGKDFPTFSELRLRNPSTLPYVRDEISR